MPKEKKKDLRSRTWALVVYPDSAPEKWRDILDSTHIAWVESPLHDKDINPDETPKKAHWHIILMFGTMKSYSQVKEVADLLHAPIPQKVQSIKGAVRYLVHTDNPEKYQYKREDIKCHGGATVDQYFKLSMQSREAVLWDIMEFIRDEELESYSAFIGYCQATDNREWFSIATNYNTLAIKTLLDSIYQDHHPQSAPRDYKAEKIAKVKEMAEQGVSQRVIADTLGISPATVNRYLKK